MYENTRQIKFQTMYKCHTEFILSIELKFKIVMIRFSLFLFGSIVFKCFMYKMYNDIKYVDQLIYINVIRALVLTLNRCSLFFCSPQPIYCLHFVIIWYDYGSGSFTFFNFVSYMWNALTNQENILWESKNRSTIRRRFWTFFSILS